MSRQEKLSRYRGLNPYVQKQKKENVAWYSTSSSFDDQKTQSFFISTSIEAINYPTTFNVSSSFLITEISTSLTTFGRTVPQNVNQYIQQQDNQLPTISAFMDIADYANDGFIVAASQSFFRTGSLIENAGFGFQQPLREKTTIEIDMPIIGDYYLSSSKDQDYLMGYYNFASKSIFTIGTGATPYDLYNNNISLNDYFLSKSIGFAPSMVDPFQNKNSFGSNIYKNQGTPIKDFGFPSDPRYTVDKNSGCLFSLSGSIKEPFLLEKAVLEIGLLSLFIDGTNFNLTNYSSAVINFFILNQRDNNLFKNALGLSVAEDFSNYANYPATSIFTDYTTSDSFPTRNTKVDLVTYFKIGTIRNKVNNSFVFPYVDLGLENQSVGNDIQILFQNKKINIDIHQSIKMDNTLSVMPLITNTGVFTVKLRGLNGTRSGVDQFSDRNWLRAIATDTELSKSDYDNKASGYSTIYNYSNNNELTVPYILLPTDNLIIGWQAPVLDLLHLIDQADLVANGANFWNNNKGVSSLRIAGNFKLTLYGSYLRMNDELEYEEYHEYDMNNESLNNVSTVVIGEPIYKGDKL